MDEYAKLGVVLAGFHNDIGLDGNLLARQVGVLDVDGLGQDIHNGSTLVQHIGNSPFQVTLVNLEHAVAIAVVRETQGEFWRLVKQVR